jgi:lysozyme
MEISPAQISPEGLELIKRCEGFRSRVYLDVAGIPTIGYGHRLVHPECFPNGLFQSQAAELLASDVRDAEQAVGCLAKVPLSQGQFDALVDFCFNLGSGRLAASTLLKDLNAGQYDSAGQQLLRWDHTGEQEIPALTARREAEFQLWVGPETKQVSAA